MGQNFYKLICVITRERICVSQFDPTLFNHTTYSAKRWRGKLWRIGNFKNLAGKTLVNCNELSLSSSIKTCHLRATLKLKPQSLILSIDCIDSGVYTIYVLSSCVALNGVCICIVKCGEGTPQI